VKLTNQTQTSFFRWRHYAPVLAVIWTVIIGSSLGWNIYQTKQKTLEVAYIQAKITLEKDIQYRRWNAGHGGVYVPVTEETPPNPYLSHIPERDLTTPSGKILTLMNPAYMTRQVNEIAKKEQSFWGHLTSLKPLRPENAPDHWEIDALKAFEQGETEVRSVKNIGGQDYFRLMRPLRTEDPCLKCHSTQGYKKGDIRGGISVSNSMDALYAIEWKSMRRVGATHLLIWLTGLGGIGLMAHRINRSEAVRKQAEEALRNSEERYHGLFENIPIGLYRTNLDGRIIEANSALVQMLGHPNRDCLLAVNSSDTYVNPQARGNWKNLMEQRGMICSYEIELRRGDGTVLLVEENSQAIRDPEGRVQYYQGSFQDITERKKMETALERMSRQNLLILQSADEGILGLDKEGKQTFVNPAAARMFGCQVEELIGHKGHHIWHHSKKDGTPYPGEECPIYKTLKDGSVKIVRGEVFWKKDGQNFPVEYAATPIGEGDRIEGAVVTFRDITERKRAEEEREKLIGELQGALAKVKTLSGLIPICASCKKIRDDKGYWNQIESYIREHSGAEFSHGICPDCMKKLYPDFCEDESNS
jgi:PAS domain S-box-containing protein